jgi:hypothetical protein
VDELKVKDSAVVHFAEFKILEQRRVEAGNAKLGDIAG